MLKPKHEIVAIPVTKTIFKETNDNNKTMKLIVLINLNLFKKMEIRVVKSGPNVTTT